MLIGCTSNSRLQTPSGTLLLLTHILYFPNRFSVSQSPEEYSLYIFLSQTSNISSTILSLSYDIASYSLIKWRQSKEISHLPIVINLPASVPIYSSFPPVKMDELLISLQEGNPSAYTLDLFCSCLPKDMIPLLHTSLNFPPGSFPSVYKYMIISPRF